jgi:hypothetical protein
LVTIDATADFKGNPLVTADSKGSPLVIAIATIDFRASYSFQLYYQQILLFVSHHKSANYNPKQCSVRNWLLVPSPSELRSGFFC